MDLNAFILLLGSTIANTLSAMAGGGAGLLQLPLLLWLGLPFSVALATHKVASVFLGVGAGLQSFKSKQFQPMYSAMLCLAGLPAVWLGSIWVVTVPDFYAQMGLGLLTLSLGIYSLQHKQLGVDMNLLPLTPLRIVIGSAVIAVIGFINGSLASGTGLFVTLWLVKYFGFTYKQASAYTLFFVGLFWNGLGGMTLWHASTVKFEWLPMLIVGSVVGGYLGVKLAQRQSNAFIKKAFEWMTVAVGIQLMVSAMMRHTN